MASKRVPENQVVMSTGAAQASPVRRPSSPRRSTRTAKPVTTLETPAAEPETAAPATVAPVAPVEELSPEAVAALAYSYWEARGATGGSPEDDWLRAEQELRVMSASA